MMNKPMGGAIAFPTSFSAGVVPLHLPSRLPHPTQSHLRAVEYGA